jgi:hypothetical protein
MGDAPTALVSSLQLKPLPMIKPLTMMKSLPQLKSPLDGFYTPKKSQINPTLLQAAHFDTMNHDFCLYRNRGLYLIVRRSLKWHLIVLMKWRILQVLCT